MLRPRLAPTVTLAGHSCSPPTSFPPATELQWSLSSPLGVQALGRWLRREGLHSCLHLLLTSPGGEDTRDKGQQGKPGTALRAAFVWHYFQKAQGTPLPRQCPSQSAKL